MRGTRLKATIDERKRGLAEIRDLRRRLAEHDFSDLPPEDSAALDAEVYDFQEHKRKTKKGNYDPVHPTMVRRVDIDG